MKSTPRPLMFHELAGYYDALLDRKDYRAEVRRLEELERRSLRSGGNRWLDVACGTGRHLELLRARHSVAGVDRSAEMLRVARRRLPRVPLVRADMRTFRLRARFDVVTCLFGAIGNVLTERGTQETLVNFARHLRPGGLLMLEPWIDPKNYHAGFLRLMVHDDPTTKVVRLAYSSSPRGSHSMTNVHFLIGERGRGIRHLEELDPREMIPYDRLLEMVRRAGLRPKVVRRGLAEGRPLILGLKPR